MPSRCPANSCAPRIAIQMPLNQRANVLCTPRHMLCSNVCDCSQQSLPGCSLQHHLSLWLACPETQIPPRWPSAAFQWVAHSPAATAARNMLAFQVFQACLIKHTSDFSVIQRTHTKPQCTEPRAQRREDDPPPTLGGVKFCQKMLWLTCPVTQQDCTESATWRALAETVGMLKCPWKWSGKRLKAVMTNLHH